MLSTLHDEFRSLYKHWLLPGLAISLPWSWALRLYRRAARDPGLYADEWRPALEQARRFVAIADETDWAWRFRLVRLIDHADYWVSRTRGLRWLRRHENGASRFPCADRAAVGVFFHWNPGLWAVRALHGNGVRAAVLAGRFSRHSMGGARLGFLYGHIRLKELERAGGRPLIYAPGTVKRALADLAAGHWVIGTPDVPPTETAFAVPVQLFGRPAWFAEGLLLIARRAGVPIVVFTHALDLATGRRELRVHGPFDPHDPALLQHIVDLWQGLIEEQSWAFSLWPAMPAWFAGPRTDR
jgi:hypothetical protein